MDSRLFAIIYLAGVIICWAVQIPWLRRLERIKTSKLEVVLMIVWFISAHLLPLANLFLSSSARYDYHLASTGSLIIGFSGVLIFSCAILLLRHAHIDLQHAWSPAASNGDRYQLVQTGCYRYIRHPMYAAYLLWGLAQGLMLQNWLIGPAAFVIMWLFYFIRVANEESALLAKYGEEFEIYRRRSGRIMPKIRIIT